MTNLTENEVRIATNALAYKSVYIEDKIKHEDFDDFHTKTNAFEEFLNIHVLVAKLKGIDKINYP